MAEAKAEIRARGRSQEEAEDYGEMQNPWLVRVRSYRPRKPTGGAWTRKSAWQESNIAKGLCRSCCRPLCRESVKYCPKHLENEQ